MKVKKMTWDDIPVHDNAPRMRELTKQELQQVSGGFWRSYAGACVSGAAGAISVTKMPSPKVAAAGCAGGVLVKAVSDAVDIALH